MKPRVPLALCDRSHRTGSRREDESVGRILKLRVENGLDRLLHHCSIARQEQLGLNTDRQASRGGHKVLLQIIHERMCASQTALQRLSHHIVVGGHQRKTHNVLAAEVIGIEDTEEVAVVEELAIHHIAHVGFLCRNQTRPCDTSIARPPKDTLVTSHNQEAARAVRLVGYGVSGKDVVRSALHQMAALHGDWVDEPHLGCLHLHAVPLEIGLGQDERRLLEGSNQRLYVPNHRLHNHLRCDLLVQHLHLQLVTRCLFEHICEGLVALELGLDQRHIHTQHPVLRCPRLAVENAEERCGIHRRTTEVLAQRLLVAKREAKG